MIQKQPDEKTWITQTMLNGAVIQLAECSDKDGVCLRFKNSDGEITQIALSEIGAKLTAKMINNFYKL